MPLMSVYMLYIGSCCLQTFFGRVFCTENSNALVRYTHAIIYSSLCPYIGYNIPNSPPTNRHSRLGSCFISLAFPAIIIIMAKM